MPDNPGTCTFGMHLLGFGGQYNFKFMERDGCDKKSRRDRLSWYGHTEKMEEQLLKHVLHCPLLGRQRIVEQITWRMKMINP